MACVGGGGTMCLLFVLMLLLPTLHALPRVVREVTSDPSYSVVTTGVGSLRGRRVNVTGDSGLDIFLGVPYGKAPTGERRFAPPEAFGQWSDTRDALTHGARCVQRIIPNDPPFESLPFAEDCLFLDIYASWSASRGNDTLVPVMTFVHGGGYYGGTGALYNFTNVALHDVIVVSVSFRLDIFGFLSTGDDVIPGNFGILDIALALDWIKANIEPFGGDPNDITVFGASSGAASTSVLYLSPLTRGKFQKAIMQSGVANCPWAVHPINNQAYDPKRMSIELGQLANCTVRDGSEFSADLLTCFRQMDVQTLIGTSVRLQEEFYGGAMVWLPVVETTYGVLPETPLKLLNEPRDLVHIPTIYGYTKEDSSWLVPNPDNNGTNLFEFKYVVRLLVRLLFDSEKQDELYNNVMKAYLPDETSKTPEELRGILVDLMTDGFMTSCIIQEARLFGRSRGRLVETESYVFEFAHRPSYSPSPSWWGVAHADEKGFVLGLPLGPDPFKYPNHDAADQTVADHVTTMWTNFAKFGDPTPDPVDNVTWPQFRPPLENEKILRIKEDLEVVNFDRENQVKVWTELFDLSCGLHIQADVRMSLMAICLLNITMKHFLRL